MMSDPATTADLQGLQGRWSYQTVETCGNCHPHEVLSRSCLRFDGNQYFVQWADKTNQGSFTLDATTSPKMITLLPSIGEHQGMAMEGIYELQDETFKAMISFPGARRPAGFDATTGDQVELVIAERCEEHG